MPNQENVVKPSRKLLPMFYVIDTSGSMGGTKIGQVNDAMRDIRTLLSEVEKSNADAELKLAALLFSSGAEWSSSSKNGLVSPDDFFWNEVSAGGLTDLGYALETLDKALSRSGYLRSDVGYNQPVIIFMSDGGPTDDYKGGLAKIKENSWFKVAIKIAIAIGDDADREVLKELVGNEEAVITVDNYETLAKLIRAVSVSASKIGSKSRGKKDDSGNQGAQGAAVDANQAATDDTTVDIVKDALTGIGDDSGVQTLAPIVDDGSFDSDNFN